MTKTASAILIAIGIALAAWVAKARTVDWMAIAASGRD
jgi:hypothetical protein